VDNWFAAISSQRQLSFEAERALLTDGFVVIPGPIPAANFDELVNHYDQAVADAVSDDIIAGSTTTRVRDFVNRDAAFDELYVYPPILQACCCVIGQPFKLSTMHARTLRPRTPAQRIHIDFPHDEHGWPMVGFILMIDDFTPKNGATSFIAGSHGMVTPPASAVEVKACGSSGSVIVFNGSVWHGHGPNQTGTPRRSIQGAYIRRTEASGETLPARMLPETLGRIGGLAKYLLTV
jgi:Phytanoyl-CoA dioxygenase (PhyH)